MTAMEKFRDGTFGPTVILLVICFFITLAMAAVFQATKPVIERGEIDAANQVRGQVLAGAETFTKIEGSYPDGVSEVYKADNGSGYVVRAAANGYGGAVTFMIGLDPAGNVMGISLFEHNETPGLGTKVGEPAYLERYFGGADPGAIDAVTGATRTSNALKESIRKAKEAVIRNL